MNFCVFLVYYHQAFYKILNQVRIFVKCIVFVLEAPSNDPSMIRAHNE